MEYIMPSASKCTCMDEWTSSNAKNRNSKMLMRTNFLFFPLSPSLPPSLSLSLLFPPLPADLPSVESLSLVYRTHHLLLVWSLPMSRCRACGGSWHSLELTLRPPHVAASQSCSQPLQVSLYVHMTSL